jgi:hypothetical protein
LHTKKSEPVIIYIKDERELFHIGSNLKVFEGAYLIIILTRNKLTGNWDYKL